MPGQDACPKCGRAMLPTTGGNFCPSCGQYEDMTLLYDASALDSKDNEDALQTPALGMRPVTAERPIGASIFESDFQLDAARPGVKPGSGATAIIPEDQVPEAPPAGRDSGRQPGSEVAFLPRCERCNKVLELDEIAGRVCAECAVGRGAGAGKRTRDKRESKEGERRRSEEPGDGRRGVGATTLRAGTVLTGSLAVAASLWAGVLVVTYLWKANPEMWAGAAFFVAASRLVLAAYALAVSILWTLGSPWAGGAILALGPAAAGLAVVQVRTGVLVGDLPAASGWLLAGTVGPIAAIAAVFLARPRKGQRGSRGNTGHVSGRRPARQDLSARQAGGRIWSVLAALLVLGAAGAAGWQAAGSPAAMPPGWSDLASLGLWGAALAGGVLGLWLLVYPPERAPGFLALAAAVVSGTLPLWLVLGMRMMSIEPPQALSFLRGAGQIFALKAVSQAQPAGTAAALAAAAGAAVVLALLASVGVLFLGIAQRGKPYAGFALSWALLWGAGLAMVFVAG